MKLLRRIDYTNSIKYIYENNIRKRIWHDGEIFWYKSNAWHKEDGAALEICLYCKNNCCYFKSINNKYKRHFYLNDNSYYPNEFAEETKHIICLICNDFCKQECFI